MTAAHAATFAALRTALANGSIAEKDLSFARSLVDQGFRKGYWSDRQAFFAQKLVAAPTPVQETVHIKVEGIIALFGRNKAKFPKVRLETATGQKLQIARAGENSRYKGSLMLSEAGWDTRYYGRISPDGVLAPTAELGKEIMALLVEFAKEPARVGARIGRETGNCCFCSKALKTTESLAVGYGPICADKFGLPWG